MQEGKLGIIPAIVCMQKSIVLVGHITNDISPVPHVGGGVSWSGIAFARLGFSVVLVTKAPRQHPYLQELKNLGIRDIYTLPVRDEKYAKTLTSFDNQYDAQFHRQQISPSQQEPITLEDWKAFRGTDAFRNLPQNAGVLIAPVIGEVDPRIFPLVKNDFPFLAVTPQGYFRYIEKESGRVLQVPWKEKDALQFSDATILSEEDLRFDQDGGYFRALRAVAPLVVLTRGEKGLTIFQKRKEKELEVKAYALLPGEVRDPTGAGDVCAAAFTSYYLQTTDMHQAGVFAALFAALKIRGNETRELGMATIPGQDAIPTFMKREKKRYETFLAENNLGFLSLFPERQRSSRERK